MRMSQGVEWGLHSCLNLAWVGPDQAVTATKLAAYYELPAAYLNKQLQALARAGILMSTSGPRGGFRLAKRPDEISLLDVVVAIEGADDAFRCDEILSKGPRGTARRYWHPCLAAEAMWKAELLWRKELASQTLAAIKASVEAKAPDTPEKTRGWFLAA